MAKLTTRQRHNLSSSVFALSGRRFPINDAAHARAALRMAPRSFNAGNISRAEERKVLRKAYHFLHKRSV